MKRELETLREALTEAFPAPEDMNEMERDEIAAASAFLDGLESHAQALEEILSSWSAHVETRWPEEESKAQEILDWIRGEKL